MPLLEFFKKRKKPTASTAKERLQIIVAHERSERQSPDYLPALKTEILNVIRKYTEINENDVSVQYDQNDEMLSVLELNITLPNQK